MSECSHKEVARSVEYTDKLLHRLNRIEGQIRGIKKMISSGSYCVDILTQSSAVSAAINAFNKELLSHHIKTCVVNDIKDEHYESVDELLKIIQKLMK